MSVNTLFTQYINLMTSVLVLFQNYYIFYSKDSVENDIKYKYYIFKAFKSFKKVIYLSYNQKIDLTLVIFLHILSF